MKILLVFNFEQSEDMTHPATYGVVVEDDEFDFDTYEDSVAGYLDNVNEWTPKKLIEDTLDCDNINWSWVTDCVPSCDRMEAIWI